MRSSMSRLIFGGYSPCRYLFSVVRESMPSRVHCSSWLHCHLSMILNISGKALRKSGFDICFRLDVEVSTTDSNSERVMPSNMDLYPPHVQKQKDWPLHYCGSIIQHVNSGQNFLQLQHSLCKGKRHYLSGNRVVGSE